MYVEGSSFSEDIFHRKRVEIPILFKSTGIYMRVSFTFVYGIILLNSLLFGHHIMSWHLEIAICTLVSSFEWVQVSVYNFSLAYHV